MGFRWEGIFCSIFVPKREGRTEFWIIRILNFSYLPLFFFLSFGKTVRLEKTQISTKRLKPAAEGRNPDSYECLSGYVSGVCIEPMATGIKYQSKNPIKLQEFLANRLLSSPSPPSPALSRDLGCIRFTVSQILSRSLARNHYYHRSFITFACTFFQK